MCDYRPWGICLAEIRSVKEGLMEVVTDFVGSLDGAEARRAVRPFLDRLVFLTYRHLSYV